MQTRNYLILCAVIAVALSASLLYIPAFANYVEQILLLFLSTNAR